MGRIIELETFRNRNGSDSGRIARLKKQIEQGLYEPDLEAVASAMLEQVEKPPPEEVSRQA